MGICRDQLYAPHTVTSHIGLCYTAQMLQGSTFHLRTLWFGEHIGYPAPIGMFGLYMRIGLFYRIDYAFPISQGASSPWHRVGNSKFPQ